MKKEVREKKIEIILKSLEKGASLHEACEEADVGWATFWIWRKNNPELENKINEIIESRTSIVEDRLFKAALEGNVTAMIFWLCNRRPDRWRNVNKIEVAGDKENPLSMKMGFSLSLDENERRVFKEIAEFITKAKENIK